ncbi:hypothetical protein J6590_067153 [Homalodisca vitripennis]|nr:hypothetical protein J6590_067153 [Homalodisca vitripennis]
MAAILKQNDVPSWPTILAKKFKKYYVCAKLKPLVCGLSCPSDEPRLKHHLSSIIYRTNQAFSLSRAGGATQNRIGVKRQLRERATPCYGVPQRSVLNVSLSSLTPKPSYEDIRTKA